MVEWYPGIRSYPKWVQLIVAYKAQTSHLSYGKRRKGLSWK